MAVFKVHHITKYEYDRFIKESVNEIKIFPYKEERQEVLQHDIEITSQPDMQVYTDYWGNRTAAFNILQPHQVLVIESRLRIRITASPEVTVNFNSSMNELSGEIQDNLKLIELCAPEIIEQQQEIQTIISSVPQTSSVANLVEELSRYVYQNFRYIKGITNIETTVDDILKHQSGVCQDFVHLLLQILRSAGIPSRYIIGYICPNKNGLRGAGATHAWVEAWIPAYGWAGIDPTNNIWVTNSHIKLAVGRSFRDCTPVKGSFRGSARQKLLVNVSAGYEDGEMFEDVSNVELEPQPAPEELPASYAGQQQQ